MVRRSIRTIALSAFLSASVGFAGINLADASSKHFQYQPGDFHQHTFYTDGAHNFMDQQAECDYYLQWWANSEHGGRRTQDGENHKWDDPAYHPGLEILGDYSASGGHQYMYRWQSLRDFVYPDIKEARSLYPDKTIISGLEWNVPGHEHCSTAIHQYDDTATAISEFEFRFDKSDPDTSRVGEPGLLGDTLSMNKDGSSKDDALVAVAWMQDLHESGLADAWVVPAHIERARAYIIEDFRNWQDAGPDVVPGFEGAPGHQVSGGRGGFGGSAVGGGTYGGSGFYSAMVGGLWDAMSAEGRKWFNYASSDDHSNWRQGGSDFWPGEYQKNYTLIDTRADDQFQAVFDGIRSGNSWHVMGDLIDELKFTAKSKNRTAMMGETLKVRKGDLITIKIKVHDPKTPNNCPLDMDNPSLAQVGISRPLSMPELDHIDLIAGTITGNVPATNQADIEATDYGTDAAVIKTFKRHGRKDKHGYHTYIMKIRADESMFIRLRGTNLPADIPNETDEAGNPLPDALASGNIYDNLDGTMLAESMFDWVEDVNTTSKLDEVAEAYADLWFYSNPIYIEVEEGCHMHHKHHRHHHHRRHARR